MQNHRCAGLNVRHARMLVDPHSGFPGHSAHALHERGRLHSSVGRLEDPGQVNRGARSAPHLLGREALEGLHAQALAGLQGAVPGIHVSLRRRGPQPALLHEMRIDGVFAAELSQLMDRLLGAVP